MLWRPGATGAGLCGQRGPPKHAFAAHDAKAGEPSRRGRESMAPRTPTPPGLGARAADCPARAENGAPAVTPGPGRGFSEKSLSDGFSPGKVRLMESVL